MKWFLRWLWWFFCKRPYLNFVVDRICGWTVVEALSRCWAVGRRRMFPRRWRHYPNWQMEWEHELGQG